MLGNRIRELRLAKGKTMQQIADSFGITRASVAGWERGDTRPYHDKLPELARILGTTVEYLLTGEDYLKKRVMAGAPDMLVNVPVIEWNQVAKWSENVQTFTKNSTSFVKAIGKLQGDAFALQVQGESMSPEFREGDIIIIDNGIDPAHGSYVIASVPGRQEPVLRRLIIDGPSRLLRQLNDEWPGQKITEIDEETIIYGVVVQKTKTYT